MTIQQMRERRSALAREARHLVDQHPGAKWGAEQDKRFAALKAEIEAIDAEVKRTQEALDLEAADAHAEELVAIEAGVSRDQARATMDREARIFDAFLRGGIENLTTEQRQYVAERRRQAQVLGAMSTGTPGEGGYLVPREFATRLVEAQKAFGGIRAVASVLSTSTGAALDYPTTDATGEEGEIVGENATVTRGDATFGIKSLGAYKFSSKDIALPIELLQDSAIDVEGHIVGRLATRIARAFNRYATVGTGTAQPEGVVTASTVGKVGANGQTTSVTYDDLVDLIHSLDPAYRANASIMTADSSIKVLKKLKDGQGRPIWLPGIDVKEPDTLLGYRYSVNQHVPAMAANAKSILFGDFSKYLIRDVMAVMLFRMTDSAFARNGQVGFLALSRHDGKLLDTGAVKHYANSGT